jgi:hypothetical protein
VWEPRSAGGEPGPNAVPWAGQGLAPAVVLLALLSVVAWIAAGRLPLARRGRRLVLATLLVHALTASRTVVAEDFVPHRLGGHLWLVLAGLGLVFAGLPGHGRLGRALCAGAGVLVLGYVLWPVGAWDWPWVRMAFGADSTEASALLFSALIASALLLGGLLASTAVAVERRPALRLWTLLALLANVVLAFAGNLVGAYAPYEDHGATHHLVAAWNTLRWFLRPFGEALVVGVGVFAWVVGARSEREAESVFD